MTTTAVRRFRDHIEPVAGAIYRFPEARNASKELGLRGWQWYFASRTAAMGRAAPPVVTAALGSWAPGLVEESLDAAWAVTDPDTVAATRDRTAQAAGERLLASVDRGRVERATELLRRATATVSPDGRAMFRAWRAAPPAEGRFAAPGRAADLGRERRGDDTPIAWGAEGWRSPDIIIATELWRGLDPRERAGFQGWTDVEIEEGFERLRQAKLVDGDALTDAGLDAREAVEVATDRLAQPMIDALGDDHDELVQLLGQVAGAFAAG